MGGNWLNKRGSIGPRLLEQRGETQIRELENRSDPG